MVKINKEICLGCGSCESICPEVFIIKNGKAEINLNNKNKSCIKESINYCPVNAISI